jgi:hypothetical protein
MHNNFRKTTARLLLSAAVVAGLAACGDGKPSESDAKKAVAASLDDCKYISLSDLKNIGDASQGNDKNHYLVQMTYNLSMKLDGDQVDHLKDYDQMVKVQNDIKRACPQVPGDKIYTLMTMGGDGSGNGKSTMTFDHQNMWLVRTDHGWQLKDGL